jgi:sugar lactone lactonase YvrE
MQPTLFARCEAVLGEGPLWDDAVGRLLWVDIRRARLYAQRQGDDALSQRALNAPVSAMGLCANKDVLVAAAGRSVGLLDPERGRYAVRIELEADKPGNRSNDGAVGADGRFWFGTMDDGAREGQGALYALSSDWTLTRAIETMSIPNGILTSPDGRELYVTDSAHQRIETRALDPRSGALSPPRLFASMQGEHCAPDGAALDEEGCLWSAQWDGACVIRFSPDGRIDRRIALPVSRPTSCAFGGADMRTLFITSARDGLSDAVLARQPLAGSVFAVRTTVRGVSYARFEGA